MLDLSLMYYFELWNLYIMKEKGLKSVQNGCWVQPQFLLSEAEQMESLEQYCR